MSTFEHDDHDDDRGRDALVHALLQEELGHAPQQDVGDRVLARFAAGEGHDAAQRVRAAAGERDTVCAGGNPRRWTLLVAAAAVLAVGGVLYESWARRAAGADDRGTTPPRPVTMPHEQDPQPPKPPETAGPRGPQPKPKPPETAGPSGPQPKPKPPETAGPRGPQPKPQQPDTAGPQGPKPRLPIGDLANLRAHLPKVTRVTVEALSLTGSKLPFRVEVAGHPITLTDKQRDKLLADLGTATERVEPAGADWQNKLVLWLDGGDRFELSIDAYGKGPRVTLHTSGMNGDLRLGESGSAVATKALEDATAAACRAHNIVRDYRDLRSYAGAAVPSPFTSLRLFDVDGEHFIALLAFANLRHLDLSGIARKLTEDELRQLMRYCEQLEELVLDGLPFADDDLHLLADMVNLRKLSLRYAKQFTGRGFSWLNVGAKRRVGPLEIDLTGVTTLTDEGLLEIARHDPETLHLSGKPGAITPSGAMALLDTKRLRTLYLIGWPTDGDWASFTAALAQRQGLEVIR